MRDADKQFERVRVLSEMMVEELEKVLEKQDAYDDWYEKKPLVHNLMPDRPESESIKRIMLMLRKETLKMERMIGR